MDEYTSSLRLSAASCPRPDCDRAAAGGTAARVWCARGHESQVDVPRERSPFPLVPVAVDHLGVCSLPADRLPVLHGPTTAQEAFAARRRLDALAEDRWRW